MGRFVPNPAGGRSDRPVAWGRQSGPGPLTRGELEEVIERAEGPRKPPRGLDEGLTESLLYPLRDGPGVAMLAAFPPFLWVLSVPVFDLVAALAPPQGQFNALALLVVPFTLPLVAGFLLALAYVLLYLGHMLVSCAMGESEHPPWPEWEVDQIAEGLGRLVWAIIVGVSVGFAPAAAYWYFFGAPDFGVWVVTGLLVFLGLGYVQLGVAVALVREHVAGAHPLAVFRAVKALGPRYLWVWLVGGFALAITSAALAFVLFDAPSMHMAAIELWAFWILALYAAMVVARVLGLCYARKAQELRWFRMRPRWACSRRNGRIYANS